MLNKICDFNSSEIASFQKETLKQDLLNQKANICIIKKNDNNKCVITIFKSPYSWTIFDWFSVNPYKEIEYLLDLDLNGGYDLKNIFIQEIYI